MLKRINFPSGKLSLEGIVYTPEGNGPFPAVIVCHPHPQYGGSMDNNVVDSLCDRLVAKPFLAFKFNFRGVGESQGTFDNGIGEEDDVRAALKFLLTRKEVDMNRIGLAGYSAGAAWGLAATYQDVHIKALAAISPPLSVFDFGFLRQCQKYKALISGTVDNFIRVKSYHEFCQTLPEPKECFTVDGADHSWWGFVAKVSETVAGFFQKLL